MRRQSIRTPNVFLLMLLLLALPLNQTAAETTTVQCESMTKNGSAVNENSSTAIGGIHVGWVDENGSGVAYHLNSMSLTNVQLRYCAGRTGGTIHFAIRTSSSLSSGSTLTEQTVSYSSTGSWIDGSYSTINVNLSGSSGNYLHIYYGSGGGINLDQVVLTYTPAISPTVTTHFISNIGTTSATSGGDISSEGSASVTARGVCWNTSGSPTTSNSHTTDGSGIGSFSSSITGLTPGTTYYVRSYATNSINTSYGEERSFTTLSEVRYDGPSNMRQPTNLKLVVIGGSGFTPTFNFYPNAPEPGAIPVGVDHVSQYRWVITAGGTFIEATLWVPIADLSGVNDPNALVWLKRSTPGSGAWTAIGGSIQHTDGKDYLVSDPFYSFSEFSIGDLSGDNPLPVEISSFSGASTKSGVRLNWKTASEQDNAGFVLYRNGHKLAAYPNVDALKGQGTSSNSTRYSYTDADVYLGESYTYTLMSVDISGDLHKYSQAVSVQITEAVSKKIETNATQYALAQNYPNPFNPSTNIRYSLKRAGTVTLKVFDMLGREIFSEQFTGNAGWNSYQFNANHLSSGIYYYQISSGHFAETKKMMLLK